MSYRLAPRGVVRLPDGLLITRDMPEWQAYRLFLKSGGVPDPLPAPPGPTVADVREKTEDKITNKMQKVMHAGAVVGGKTYPTDAAALAGLARAVQFSALRPLRVFKIKTANGQHVTATAAQTTSLFDALGERSALCWDNEAAHYAAVAAIATNGTSANARIAALRAYDFSTGWPD